MIGSYNKQHFYIDFISWLDQIIIIWKSAT